ncbi:MAG: RidA family protein [Candidatus Limnocylindria bacterium]
MERIQPSDVFDPRSYAQCIRAGNTLYVAGQAAQDRDGNVVGVGDVAAQADAIWRQIGSILAAAGASYRHIVKVTTYVTDMAAREPLMATRKRYLGDHVAASTLVGVTALARPEMLVEVDVVAVLE